MDRLYDDDGKLVWARRSNHGLTTEDWWPGPKRGVLRADTATGVTPAAPTDTTRQHRINPRSYTVPGGRNR